MVYVPLTAPAPTMQTFLPFSDNVASAYSTPGICGPVTHKIAEAYAFVSIAPPTSNEFVDPWTISVSTNLLSFVGTVYTATMVATFANYPTATPASLQFEVLMVHPCDLTILQPFVIMPMTFTLGFVQTVTQIFPQFKDDVSE